MAINLNEMSRKELMTLRNDIDKTLSKLVKKEKKEALAAAQKVAADFGFSLDELTTKRKTGPGASKSTQVAPKYANPDDATQTWTGKGRQPNWFKTAISSGKTAKDLEI